MGPELSANLAARWAELPAYLSGHVSLVAVALVIGIAVSIPIGIVSARHPRLKGPLLSFISVIQTVPSIALLALMVPILGGTIGFMPALIALTLYSMLPIVRNTITGLDGIDPALTEAAKSVGMTPRQQLVQVDLPIAAPVILAGIRTAAVWVVGTATLSTPVGAESLGNYIFAGLQTRNWTSVVFGCVFAALIAIFLDQMIRIAENAFTDRRPHTAYGVGALLLGVFLAGISVSVWERSPRTAVAGLGSLSPTIAVEEQQPLTGKRIRVGAKSFTEQYILTNLIERHLEARGADVKTLENLGSTILFDALASEEIDLYVDYTGTIWATIMKRTDVADRLTTYIEVSKYLMDTHGIAVIGRLGFENAYGFAMRRDQAQRLQIRTIPDINSAEQPLRIGADPEFFVRKEWTDVRAAYGLPNVKTRSMDSTLMYEAVRTGQVDIITAYTSDGRIAAYDLQILEDPEKVLPPYDAILLMSPKAYAVPGLADALLPLVNAITPDLMREANKIVDLDRQGTEEAGAFLWRHINRAAPVAPETTE